MEYTAIPYKVAEGEFWISIGTLDGNAPLIADMIGWQPDEDGPGPRSRDECRANARFIVTACNNHARLEGRIRELLIAFHEAFDLYFRQASGVKMPDDFMERYQRLAALQERTFAEFEEARAALKEPTNG